MKQASPVGINDSEWEQEIQEIRRKIEMLLIWALLK
jgi:hypothetical protein